MKDLSSWILRSWVCAQIVKDFTFSPILYGPIRFVIRSVLFVLDTNWTHEHLNRESLTLCKLLRRKRNLVAGGRDRTADLGVMNHHPGKNVSFCFFESCSHQGFSCV